MKNIPGLLLIITLFSFLSCGSDDDDDGAVNQQEQEQTPSIGEFTAQLIPVNPAIVSNPSSTNNIRIADIQVSARLSVSGLSAGTNQKQHIHIGRSCPSIADDTNQDGFVDGV